MHITMLALGSRGDIQPYVALGKGLRRAGHEVSFITFESFLDLVEQAGLDFYPIRGNAQSLVMGAGANMLALVRSFGSLAEGYAQDLGALIPKLKETELLINQLPLALYGYDLAEKLSIPMLAASVIPLTRTRVNPIVRFPLLPVPGYNLLTYKVAEQLGWQIFRRPINQWRRQVLDLHPIQFLGYFNQLGSERIPVLNGFSPQVVPRPDDWSDHVHVTGYWVPQDDDWHVPDELRAFIESGAPPVFIGFGSMPVNNPEQTTKIVLEALRRCGQRCVLHTGWAGIGEDRLPDNVFKIAYAPYSWLFPRMAMVIHHGGSGTTAFGLRAGVPSLLVPFVFDQFYWGKRVADLGVGPKPIPFGRLSIEGLAEAISIGTSDPEMRQRAAELGRKIQAKDGIGNAVEIIARYSGSALD